MMMIRSDSLTHKHALFTDTVCAGKHVWSVSNTHWRPTDHCCVMHMDTRTHNVSFFKKLLITHENSMLICELQLKKDNGAVNRPTQPDLNLQTQSYATNRSLDEAKRPHQSNSSQGRLKASKERSITPYSIQESHQNPI